MINNLKINKYLWLATTLLTLITAAVGIVLPNIYDKVFAKEFIPGALPQDILTVIICVGLFAAITRLKETSVKTQIVIMGVIGSFFYLYGIFTIERVYNFLYLFYAAIFGLSFWSLLYSLLSLKSEVIKKVNTTPGFFKISAIFGLVIAVLFTGLWISALVPLMRDNNRIEYLYSIYILDLCFIMPAFFITSILSLKKKAMGIVFLPAVYVVGFFVIFPLGLGEVAKQFYGQVPNYGQMTMSFVFSVLMLACGAWHLKQITMGK